MVSLSISNLVVFAFLALLVASAAAIILALLGIKRSIRHSRFWRYALPGCIAVALLQVVLLFNHRDIEQSYNEAVQRYYTHHLSAPKVFDGMHFPAGSTVVQSTWSPHTVTGGTVPAGTTLLGLTIRGDFAISYTGDDIQTPYLSEGILARPMTIHDVPCAGGEFKHAFDSSSSKESVDCTLASNHAVGELVLPAGSQLSIAFDTYRRGEVEVSGDVPRDWSALGVRCAKGWFAYDDDLECTPAVKQLVAGYPLAAGHDVTVYRQQDGEVSVGNGVLAGDVEVAGVRIPAGSTIDAIYDGHGINADQLRNHDMDDHEYVRFELSKGARMEAEGTVLQGDSVSIEIYRSWIRASITTDSGTDHTAMRNGEFDMASRTWRWKTLDD